MNDIASLEVPPSPEELPPCDFESAQSGYRIQVANEHPSLVLDEPALIAAVHTVLENSPVTSADVSLAVVDDPTIQTLNAKFLAHNYPTDVLSFALEAGEHCLEGELIVSGDTAIRAAEEAGWSAHDELRLYVIHGALHLVGYDDRKPHQLRDMLAAELLALRKLGVALPRDCSRWQEVLVTEDRS